MKRLLVLLALWLPLTAMAAIDTFTFKDEATRDRFQHLTSELRCPKCQNTDIRDSNSPIAKDLRTEIHKMLEEGKSDQDIIDYMVARYGDFVLYKPRKTHETMLLWYGPFGVLAIGALVVVLITRRRRQRPDHPERALSDAEQRRLDEILKQDKQQ